MNHAKFCLATQGWSTPVCVKPCLLLRRATASKQEEDHVRAMRAMALRGEHGPAAITAAQTKSAPEIRGAVVWCQGRALGRFGLDDLGLGFAVPDRDLTRLLGFRNLADEIDVQQAVLEAGVLDLDMVGQLEDAL